MSETQTQTAQRLSGRHLGKIVRTKDGLRGRLDVVRHHFDEVMLGITADPQTYTLGDYSEVWCELTDEIELLT